MSIELDKKIKEKEETIRVLKEENKDSWLKIYEWKAINKQTYYDMMKAEQELDALKRLKE